MEIFKSFDADLSSVNDGNFSDIAVQLFRFQAEHNPVYKQYIKLLGVQVAAVTTPQAIPFLPISFFKNHDIKTGSWLAEAVFTSSGTTGQQASHHHVRHLQFYLEHSLRCFQYFFGDVADYHFLALLPSYLERRDSSLVAMIQFFMQKTRSNISGFYINNIAELMKQLQEVRADVKKTVLWGVSFALLDLAERYKPDLSHCLVFETGGMKGRRREMIRQELHALLKDGLNTRQIFSEYGMTELFSQAYTRGENAFYCPPWMKVVARDISDPLEKGLLNEAGGINVIDLANFDSIAFIETEDIGKVFNDGSFEILGRLDNSDVRGCNLMVE